MSSVDYEAEYNNRARVPDHPEIFARWEREAAAYRERMKAEENAELGLAYGPSARQTVDLFFPDATGHTPLALFIHGGYWRSLHPSTFSHMSAGLNARGVGGILAQRERDAVGCDRADQRRAAHLHGLDRARSVRDGFEP